ncbi:hypothetical protein A2U01_0107548, partial [Trifolium medium]|nr:hypothetical protein [Trifolium medium]
MAVPQLPRGPPMEMIMAVLVNTIYRQGEVIRQQNGRLQVVEESRVTRIS